MAEKMRAVEINNNNYVFDEDDSVYTYSPTCGDAFAISLSSFENQPKSLSVLNPRKVTIGANNNLVFSDEIKDNFELTAFCFVNSSLSDAKIYQGDNGGIIVYLIQTKTKHDEIDFYSCLDTVRSVILENEEAVIYNLD